MPVSSCPFRGLFFVIVVLFCFFLFLFCFVCFVRFCDSCHISTKIFYLLAMFSFMTSALCYVLLCVSQALHDLCLVPNCPTGQYQ